MARPPRPFLRGIVEKWHFGAIFIFMRTMLPIS